MDKRKQGNAYIMVMFAAFPILLAALTVFAVSINSRNISARHTVFFGTYELASAANIFVMLDFQEAYFLYRDAAHRKALIYFEELLENSNEKSETLPASYVDRFRYYLLPMIWRHLESSFAQQGNVLTRQFEINLGTNHTFCGTMRVERASNRIYFRASVTKKSENIVPVITTVQGVIRWPAPVERKVEFCCNLQIKNLDYFTPWVVELKRL